ncbi:MAG: AAA family ATPase, partial [Deltaproteobacteria bacterium]|nr:AAA family ATPase [Deltaproteobacteria bacterium]
PVEVKSGKTISPDFFKGLRFWSKISGAEGRHMVLVYAGEMEQNRTEGRVLSWKSLGRGDLF